MLITDVWNDGNVFYFNWEPELMASLQKSLGPAAEKICTILSMLGEEYVMIAVFAVIYLWINKEAGRFIGTTLCTALVWNPFIKNLFLRIRPYLVDSRIKCLKVVEPEAPVTAAQPENPVILQETPATDWEARVDYLYNEGSYTIDHDEAKKIWDEYQQIILEQCPVIYLMRSKTFFAIRNKWDLSNVYYDNKNGALLEHVFLKQVQ